ncbi:hypothetical protein DFH09DRAFT_1069552 [Mycena vulgaris]|nr:hypothetical protein DFH09DRAFT_1069552 [Mycena vulgaris]
MPIEREAQGFEFYPLTRLFSFLDRPIHRLGSADYGRNWPRSLGRSPGPVLQVGLSSVAVFDGSTGRFCGNGPLRSAIFGMHRRGGYGTGNPYPVQYTQVNRPLAPGAGPLVPVEIVVEANGYATCPDCEESVHCGTGGVGNLRKRHMGSKPCLAAQAKKSTTQNKQFHDSKISGWLLPKPVRVPTTVAAPAPIQVIAAYAPRELIPLPTHATLPPPTASLRSVSSSLLTRLEAALQTVPSTVPEATDGDILAAFNQDPAHYVDPDVPAIEIFENLHSILHTTLGWAMPVEETAGLLRRGAKGLDGLLRFFRYFVEDRGGREQDFGSKIQQILRVIKFLDSDDIQIVAHLTARALRVFIIWNVSTFWLWSNLGRVPPAPRRQVLHALPSGFGEAEKYKES